MHINGYSYGYKELGEYLVSISLNPCRYTYSRLAVCIPDERCTHQVQQQARQQQLQ